MCEIVVVVNARSEERRELCRILEQASYRAKATNSLPELLSFNEESRSYAVILDLDCPHVDNRAIRNLSKENPELRLIGISNRTFHPDLEESMRTHISACLSKPVDPDELIYWLRSICGGGQNSRASPPDDGV